MQILAVPDRLA
ncbi:hypothetical protein YPPY65_2830, partial [Yersinia pestis PY-65]